MRDGPEKPFQMRLLSEGTPSHLIATQKASSRGYSEALAQSGAEVDAPDRLRSQHGGAIGRKTPIDVPTLVLLDLIHWVGTVKEAPLIVFEHVGHLCDQKR
jgi:hypothetical protein